MEQLINRGNNLFLVGFIGVAGVAGIPAIVGEGSLRGGFDEAAMLLVGIGGVAWYRRSRRARSLVPLAFVGADMLLKVVALLIEDADDRGDDLGILITLVVLTVTWLVVYVRTRPQLGSSTEAGHAA